MKKVTWVILDAGPVVLDDLRQRRLSGGDERRVLRRHVDVRRAAVPGIGRAVDQLRGPGREDRGREVGRRESGPANALQFRRALAEGHLARRVARVEALLQLTGLVTVETQEAIRVTIVDWKKKKPVKFRSLSEKLSRSDFFSSFG